MRIISFKFLGSIMVAFVSLAIIWSAGRALTDLDKRSSMSGLQVTREAIERTVMQCYALEGAYPPDISYLQQHYGLVVSEERYAIYYDVVADNIYPVVDIQLREDVQYD